MNPRRSRLACYRIYCCASKKCIGCGFCAETCPEVFEMGSDKLAHVQAPTGPMKREDSCRGAAAGCPVEAIELQG